MPQESLGRDQTVLNRRRLHVALSEGLHVLTGDHGRMLVSDNVVERCQVTEILVAGALVVGTGCHFGRILPTEAAEVPSGRRDPPF